MPGIERRQDRSEERQSQRETAANTAARTTKDAAEIRKGKCTRLWQTKSTRAEQNDSGEVNGRTP